MEDVDWIEEDVEIHTDFNHLKQKHTTHGFREGTSKGQEYILQKAFNDGFQTSAKYFESLSQYRGSISAIYMFLMSQSSYTENIGNKIEMLITKIENLENEKRHIDYLTTIEEKKREMEEHSEQRKTILDPLQDNAIDMLANSFDNLEQPIPDNNSLCCMTDEQNSCRKNDQKQVNCDCNCSLSVRNAEYIVAHETLHKKVENSRESTTEEHLSNELQILHDIILEDLSKILDRFDESLRNKLLGQLKQV